MTIDFVASGFGRKIHRVLMTVDAVGGVWQYSLDLSRGLIGRGVAVDLAVMGPSPSAAQRADAAASGATLIEAPYRLEWMEDAWADVDAASRWLLDLERACRPDVVHLNGFCHGPLPWRAPVVMVGHSCVRSWWRAVHGDEAPVRWDAYRERVSAGIRSADMVIAPTMAMLRALEDDYGPLRRARLVPNGRDFVPPAAVRREPFVLSAGRVWDEAKNVDALCAAARTVSWPVCIAGDTRPPWGACLLSGHARFLGRLEDAAMREWYARASIYALPARYEPFGLSVLEAARSGCALVLGDIRSLRENWTGAALFVPPDNRRAIASAIQSLIDDPGLRDELSWRAQARSQQFTVDRMVGGYLGAYGDVARCESPVDGPVGVPA